MEFSSEAQRVLSNSLHRLPEGPFFVVAQAPTGIMRNHTVIELQNNAQIVLKCTVDAAADAAYTYARLDAIADILNAIREAEGKE